MKRLISVILMLTAGIPALMGANAFQELNGLVVCQVESAPLAGSWIRNTEKEGFTGSCYYTWGKGTPTTLTAAGEGVLSYPIKITRGGTYNFRWYNYHNYPADQTLCNDSWVRFDNGSWIKVHQGAGGAWSWVCKYDVVPHEVFDYLTVRLSAGYHTVQISGRSFDHSIDRFHLFLDDAAYKPMSLDHPESPREGTVIPADKAVEIISPAPGTPLVPGQRYTFTGTGTVCFWKHDVGDDGVDIKSAGTNNERAITIPADATGEIAVHLTGTYGTDKVVYPVSTSSIRYLPALPGMESGAAMTVYDGRGREVRNTAGAGETWQAGLAPGVYYCLVNGQVHAVVLTR